MSDLRVARCQTHMIDSTCRKGSEMDVWVVFRNGEPWGVFTDENDAWAVAWPTFRNYPYDVRKFSEVPF